jgi:hypothetical protein
MIALDPIYKALTGISESARELLNTVRHPGNAGLSSPYVSPSKATAMWERDYHLAQANQHIAEAKQRIARQRDFIAMLESANQPSEPALSMLEALEKSLTAFKRHNRSWRNCSESKGAAALLCLYREMGPSDRHPPPAFFGYPGGIASGTPVANAASIEEQPEPGWPSPMSTPLPSAG